MKWSTAVLLYLAILALMVLNSSNFFFHQDFYEIDDWAANSISVHQAKHFAELHGNYSRWGFHHPGPAFFYLYAFGEWLFYDTLHLVAAPFNGQLLIHLILMTGYFVVILAIFSRWLPRAGGPWFIPAALALSAMHFFFFYYMATYVFYTLHAPSAIASPWSAHALVMPMLCLLTVGASVAAGRGQYLPLLAFADGCLIHTHVAQPLFIAPLTLLAYLGLCWQGWQKRRPPWQEFGGSHIVALLILAVFALPIVGDFFQGPNSNFAAILHHIRTHHGEHKPLMRSLFYFLQFGSYTEYGPHRNDFGRYDLHGALVYLGRYAAYYIMWLAAAILALRPLVTSFQRRGDAEAESDDAIPRETLRFLAWGGVFLAAGFGLTIIWGIIQDGAMTYFNAWFNYAIYHFVALLGLASLCARPTTPATSRRQWWVRRVSAAAAVLVVCVVLAGALRVDDPLVESGRITRDHVAQAIADSEIPGQMPATKLLIFTQETWEVAAGVALQLTRANQSFVVLDQWVIVVGESHRWKDFPATPLLNQLQIFRLHAHFADTAHAPLYSLPIVGAALTTMPSVIDPADEALSTIEFRPHDNNFLSFQVVGWSAKENWGTWNDGHISLLAFHPMTADGSDVAMRLDAIPLLAPQHGLTEQTVSVFFNGEQIGHERALSQPEEAMTFTIPSKLWEQAANEPPMTPATLEFRFPNATAPRLVDPDNTNGDMRTLAVGFHQLQFSKVEPGTSEEAEEQQGQHPPLDQSAATRSRSPTPPPNRRTTKPRRTR